MRINIPDIPNAEGANLAFGCKECGSSIIFYMEEAANPPVEDESKEDKNEHTTRTNNDEGSDAVWGSRSEGSEGVLEEPISEASTVEGTEVTDEEPVQEDNKG